MDGGLRTYKIPYNGLNDLLVSFLGIPKPDYGHIESAIVDVIAPIQMRLGNDCKLSDGRLTVHAEIIKYDNLEDISIGLITHSGNIIVQRTSFTLEKTDWKGEKGLIVSHKEVNVGKVTSVDIFLSFRSEYLDKLTISDPAALLKNPRILGYNHFDKDLNKFKGYLKYPDQETFEKGISLLLHFCGFNTAAYGLIKGKKGIGGIHEEIDLIAFIPSNQVIAGECPIREIDINGKLSKFARKVKQIQELLKGFSIIPLIFTTLKSEEVTKTDIEKAKNEGIGVVTCENINELFEMAGLQRQPNEILTYLKSLILIDEHQPWKMHYR